MYRLAVIIVTSVLLLYLSKEIGSKRHKEEKIIVNLNLWKKLGLYIFKTQMLVLFYIVVLDIHVRKFKEVSYIGY